nr:PREDICTED: uncharacterized protein LOC109042944 [Bemisia tabaci]
MEVIFYRFKNFLFFLCCSQGEDQDVNQPCVSASHCVEDASNFAGQIYDFIDSPSQNVDDLRDPDYEPDSNYEPEPDPQPEREPATQLKVKTVRGRNNRVKNPNYKREWDRVNYCLLCKKTVTTFSRHLKQTHKLSTEAKTYINITHPDLKVQKRLRTQYTDKLRRQWNAEYNKNSTDCEKFLPARRTKAAFTNVSQYLKCKYCDLLLAKKSFYRHVKVCSEIPQDIREQFLSKWDVNLEGDTDETLKIGFGISKRVPVQRDFGEIIFPNLEATTEKLQTAIFPTMQKDDLYLIAMNDRTLRMAVSLFYETHSEDKDQYQVSRKLRDGANLLKQCRAASEEIKEFADIFHPKHIDVLTKAVRVLAKYDFETGKVGIIGMGDRLSWIIQECAKCVFEAVCNNVSLPKEELENRKTNINDFLLILRNKWKYIISTNSRKTKLVNKCTKPVIMPHDDDVITVGNKLKELEIIYYNKVKQSPSPVNYENLLKVTIAHCITFNRRRSGEIALASLKSYVDRPPPDDIPQDALAQLSKEELESADVLSVFLVVGKNLKSVPTLLTKQMKLNIDLIIECRKTLGLEESPYLFPRVLGAKPFTGSDIISDVRALCTLKKSEHYTATGLRHHLATKTAIHGDSGYLEKVCEFMGHTKDVHRNNYRFPIELVQKGQIGKNLLLMENGHATTSISNEIRNIDDIVEPEQVPPGQVPPGQVPPGQVPLGQVPPGQVPPGQVPPGQVPPGQVPPVLVEQNVGAEPNELPFPSTSDDNLIDLESINASMRVQRSEEGKIKLRKRWTLEEATILLNSFADCFRIGQPPGVNKCLPVMRKYACLQSREWRQVKAQVQNYMEGKTKLPPGFEHLQYYVKKRRLH